jgi:hypothetical protein
MCFHRKRFSFIVIESRNIYSSTTLRSIRFLSLNLGYKRFFWLRFAVMIIIVIIIIIVLTLKLISLYNLGLQKIFTNFFEKISKDIKLFFLKNLFLKLDFLSEPLKFLSYS